MTLPSRERTREVAPSTQKSAPDAKPQFQASAWLDPQVCCCPPGAPSSTGTLPLSSNVPETESAGWAPMLTTDESACHRGRRKGKGASRETQLRSHLAVPRSVWIWPEQPSRSSEAPSSRSRNGRDDVCSARSGNITLS